VEGTREGHWILLDYGHVIIHVFYEPVREFFDLEGLWSDAKRITTPTEKTPKSSSKAPKKIADI
jgi:ribosomal silencing factor RsfS